MYQVFETTVGNQGVVTWLLYNNHTPPTKELHSLPQNFKLHGNNNIIWPLQCVQCNTTYHKTKTTDNNFPLDPATLKQQFCHIIKYNPDMSSSSPSVQIGPATSLCLSCPLTTHFLGRRWRDLASYESVASWFVHSAVCVPSSNSHDHPSLLSINCSVRQDISPRLPQNRAFLKTHHHHPHVMTFADKADCVTLQGPTGSLKDRKTVYTMKWKNTTTTLAQQYTPHFSTCER